MKKIALALTAVVLFLPASLTLASLTEDFEDTTAYPNGVDIANNADWYADASAGPTINDGIGVAGSRGGTQDGRIFVWSAHPFSWTNDLNVGDKIIAKADFQTSSSGVLDDDRIGWMLQNDSSGSNYIFGVQADPGGSGAGGNIECYWDASTFGDDGGRTSIADLPALSNSGWYRMSAEFTKLGDTSARIDVDFSPLDAAGNLQASIASGSIADTSLLGASSPLSEYFTGLSAYGNQMWPAFKNHEGPDGNFDNAYFDVVPEPSSMVLAMIGLLGLLAFARRKRS